MPVRAIAVTGPSTAVGRRVVAAMADSADVRVVAAGECDARHLDGADAVVNLEWEPTPPRAGPTRARANVELVRRLLSAADQAGVRTLVHVSSAIAYGAWADNPIPLTEEAALRPNPGVADAVGHAEAERLILDWADEHPGSTVTILRPATVVGPGVTSWLAEVMCGHTAVRTEAEPPRQFVHVDDLAAAAVTAIDQRLDGVFNVAPDGSAPADLVRGLTAGRPSLPVPRRLAAAVSALGWALQVSDLSPAALALIEFPWIVANDRLRAAGWAPRFTNEEAVVAGRPGSWWREMSPARRQQVALAGAGTAVAAIGGGVAAAVLAARRGRPRG
jgi:nucleoside-diphosphate-sugar epimerase